jgi:hypothetical protein
VEDGKGGLPLLLSSGIVRCIGPASLTAALTRDDYSQQPSFSRVSTSCYLPRIGVLMKGRLSLLLVDKSLLLDLGPLLVPHSHWSAEDEAHQRSASPAPGHPIQTHSRGGARRLHPIDSSSGRTMEE